MLKRLCGDGFLAVLGCGTVGFVGGLLLVGQGYVTVGAQNTPPATAPKEKHAQATAKGRVFGSDAGLVLNFIKPEKTGDFEAIVAKVKEALQKSDKPEWKQQAASWKVFRALEPGGNGSVLYMFKFDPAVPAADYTVSTILAEAFPSEVAVQAVCGGVRLRTEFCESDASIGVF
jgi:hypothetical protein